MKKVAKRIISFVLISLTVLMLFLTGCGKTDKEYTDPLEVNSSSTVRPETTSVIESTNDIEVTNIEETANNIDEPPVYGEYLKGTLRVVTEDFGESSSELNVQLQRIIGQFEITHPSVTIDVEYLPFKDAEAREIALDQLRTEIMAGKGPDIYLLPTSGRPDRNPLFFDVNQSMRNGLFADISEYYDSDSWLEKEELLTKVMDAGIIDGARYILPLRYNIPVAYVDMEDFKAAGLSTDIFSSGIARVMDAAVATGDSVIAASVEPLMTSSQSFFYYFSDFIDYDNKKILLPKEEIVAFLGSYLSTRELMGSNWSALNAYPLSLSICVEQSFPFWANTEYCMAIDDLNVVLENAAVAKAENIELGMFPITTADGDLVADVTYYGAVDGHCQNSELAYAFLREFLSAETQWESNVYGQSSGFGGMVTRGYPVRVEGSVPVLYKNLLNKVPINGLTAEEKEPKVERKEQLSISLTNEDIPILQARINQVRFPTYIELQWNSAIIDLCNENTGISADVNAEALAEELIKELEWHLYEG